METKKIQELPVLNQWIWGLGALGYALLERMLITYVIFFYLSPKEYQVVDLVTDRIYLGVFTVLGIALLLGRIVDGLADPIIAALSDKTRSSLGRRKPFMLASVLPLSAAAILMFYPPRLGETSALNGIWACAIWLLFYIFFTAYITPYFALIPELGHSHSIRINLGTVHAFFVIMGMIAMTVVFPLIAAAFQKNGFPLRPAYQYTAALFTLIALLSLLLATFSFNEKKHCLPSNPPASGMWKSMLSILSIKAFRTFLIGELFFQYAIFMLNLGLLYYVVVIFRQEESFLTILGGLTIGIALLSFPLVNKAAKAMGKKKPLLLGVAIMTASCFILFALSWNMNSTALYLGVLLFGLGGISLSTCTILTVPTYADMARVEALRTGVQREAMYYAARNLPLKMTIALAGATFSYLIAAFGKDMAKPLGVQLSLLIVAAFSLIGLIFFAIYPEQQILEQLSKYETKTIDFPNAGRQGIKKNSGPSL